MVQALSNTNTYLYADDTSIFCHRKNVTLIETVLNKELANECDWFVNNKLSIHFVEDKTKCIFFCSRDKNLAQLNITFDNNRIKQYSMAEYLGCCLHVNLKGEYIAMKSLSNINTKLQYLYGQNESLNPKVSRLFCSYSI